MSEKPASWAIPTRHPGTSYFRVRPTMASRFSEAAGVIAIIAMLAWLFATLFVRAGFGAAALALMAFGTFVYVGSRNNWFARGLRITRSRTDAESTTVEEPDRVVEHFEMEIEGENQTVVTSRIAAFLDRASGD